MTKTTIAARAVVVDIEGTTSTIAFVHDVLFPYADERLDAYVAAHRGEPAVAQALLDAAREAGEEPDADDATILAHLHRWMAEDRKSTPLKTLQGLIWTEGYERTGLRGHVYPDAAAGLRRWHDAGLALLRPLADRQDQIGKREVELPAREMLADILLEMNRPQDALAEYAKSLQSDPNRFDGLDGALAILSVYRDEAAQHHRPAQDGHGEKLLLSQGEHRR